ncbi:MAG: hypothetical protein COY57_08200, partial [Flavobacteriales bacterium CG_4_10_14_0_8_um_filter_32_5]
MFTFHLNIKLYKVLLILLVGLFSCKSSKKIVEPTQKAEVQIEIPEPVETETTFDLGAFLSEYLNLKYPDKDFSSFLFISVKHQQMYLIEKDSIIKKYTVSTAKKGVGNELHSLKTPLGLHNIKRKIGDNVPLGGILEARVYNGSMATIYEDKTKADGDYVTTRILWLDGEEVGINKGRNIDSYNRFIYIHGTPEEGYIGEPVSHGCIR